MPLFEVQVFEERMTTIYVEADTERKAEDAAFDLSADQEGHRWNEVDSWTDVDIVGRDEIPSGARIWVGGAKGRWEVV